MKEPASELIKVLVIGDSTSFGIASALSCSGAGKVQVLWGGGQNCPLVPVAEIRWWEGAQWNMERCPSPSHGWPDLVSGFDPAVVLAIASLPEQSEQRYRVDGQWFTAGDPEFTAAHDDGMRQLQDLLAATQTVTILANAPAIVEGAFAGSNMAADSRVAAWNDQISSWDLRWTSVASFDWATVVHNAESAGYHRPDGIHFSQSDLDTIVSSDVVDQLVTIYELISNPATASAP